MPRKLVRLRDRNQITLPDTVVEKFHLEPGDFLEFLFHESQVEVRPARIAKAGTPEAEERETRAMVDVEQGRFGTFDTVAELQQHLEERAAKVEKAAAAEELMAQDAEVAGAPASLPDLLAQLEEIQPESASARRRLASRLVQEEAARMLRRAAEQAAYESKYETG